ncbi:MFS transporter [Streptomyces sp. NPDC002734]|uniref:MFS transporter n=1 Tax=Streptomyces sp. NPDC002734 TaxID=3154426 RepID=UPI003333B057
MPLALLALAVGAFGIGTTEFVMMGLLPQVAADLGVSIPSAGHLISAYALGVVVGAPLLAAVTARMERRQVLLWLMGLFIVGNGLSALAPDHTWLLGARFLSGLPHGAFFGVGSVVATTLVAPEKRARSVATMLTGLTVANIVGVPVGTLLGQQLGWRATFGAVCVIGLAAVAALFFLVPQEKRAEHAAPPVGLRGELAALRSVSVWLVLGTTIVGSGALFSAFSYITPMLTDAAGYAEASVTLVLSLFGVGATAGNLLGGRLADRSPSGTVFAGLGAVTVTLLFFPLLMDTRAGGAVAVLLLGVTAFTLGAPLQLMVMTRAASAPSLASSANQAAFNLANAGGAWIGGLALSAGLGVTSPAPVGSVLAVLGIGVAALSLLADRRERRTGRVVATHLPAPESTRARAEAE